MKAIYFLAIVSLIFFARKVNTISNAICPVNFQCNKEGPSNVCATKKDYNNTKNLTNPPLYTISLTKNACKETQICNFVTGACSDIQTLSYYSTPGQKVKSSSFCKSKKAINGICQGSSKDSQCEGDTDCDPGLYCKSNKCQNYTMYGKSCTAKSDKCQLSYKCQLFDPKLYGNSTNLEGNQENTCTRFNSSISAFSYFFKICKQNASDTDIATRCIAAGSLTYNATNATDVCKYSNGEKALPNCAANGSVYCFKGLSDVSDLTDNFFLYLKGSPNCTYGNPICSNGKNILAPSLYSSVISGISNLLNIPHALNSTIDCLDEYITFLRAGITSLGIKRNLEEEDAQIDDLQNVLADYTSQYNDQQNEANAVSNQTQQISNLPTQYINLLPFVVILIILF